MKSWLPQGSLRRQVILLPRATLVLINKQGLSGDQKLITLKG